MERSSLGEVLRVAEELAAAHATGRAVGEPDGAGFTSMPVPGRCAPERLRGEPPTRSSDLFGLGVLLHEALAGEPPFGGEGPLSVKLAVLEGRRTRLVGREGVPEALAVLGDALLAASPEDRPRDTAAVRDLLFGGAAPSPTPSPAVAEAPPERFVDRVEIGRGGLGRVDAAWDTEVGRRVAIKVLVRPDEQGRARFLREAAVTARLQHPGIVPVYEVGRAADGEPYLVMRLVEGETLEARAVRARGMGDRLTLLPAVRAAADAVAYAHALGVVHRDLKPANILLGPFGETVVIDWGLAGDAGVGTATQVSAEPRLTMAGAVLGTPGFMSPEVAGGAAATAASDVFSLGAVLWFVLTGRPVVGGRDVGSVLSDTREGRIRLDDPPDVAPELLAVVRKALAVRVEDRYPDAAGLSSDLGRWLEGRLVAAHSYTATDHLRRWVRRHQAALGVSAVAVVGLLVAAGWAAVRVEQARRVAVERGDRLALQAARELVRSDPAVALDRLASISPSFPGWGEVRVVAAEALGAPARQTLDDATAGEAHLMAASADGARLAWPGDGAARLVDQRGRSAAVPDADVGVLSGSGAWFGTSGRGGVALWSADELLDGGTAASRWSDPRMPRFGALLVTDEPALYWSPAPGELWRGEPGGAALWARCGGGPITQVESESGVVVFSTGDGFVGVTGRRGEGCARASAAAVWRLAVTRDGALAALADADGALRVVRLPELTAAAEPWWIGTEEIRTLAWSADGASVAFTALGSRVRELWPGDGRRTERDPGLGALEALARLPDGGLAVGAVSGDVAVMAPSGDVSRTFHAHAAAVLAVVVAPDGDLVTQGRDLAVRRWTLGGGPVARYAVARSEAVDPHHPPTLVAVREDGAWLVAQADAVRAVGPGVRPAASWPAEAVHALVGLPGGAAWLGRDGGVWRGADGGSPERFAEVGQGRFLVAAAEVVAAAGPHRVEVFGPSGRRGRAFDAAEISALAVSPDGREVLVGQRDGAVSVWQWEADEVRPLPVHRWMVGVALWADGWVTGAGDGTLRWLPAGGGVAELEGRSWHRLIALRDGSLVGAGVLGQLHRVRLASMQVGPAWLGHQGAVTQVALSPEGARLASASTDRTVRVWDLASGAGRTLSGHGGRVLGVAWARDGERLLSWSEDGQLAVWADALPLDAVRLKQALADAAPAADR